MLTGVTGLLMEWAKALDRRVGAPGKELVLATVWQTSMHLTMEKSTFHWGPILCG